MGDQGARRSQRGHGPQLTWCPITMQTSMPGSLPPSRSALFGQSPARCRASLRADKPDRADANGCLMYGSPSCCSGSARSRYVGRARDRNGTNAVSLRGGSTLGWGSSIAPYTPRTRTAVALDVPTLISVIIPTFDRGNVLPEAIDSVLAQTHRDIDVIVVDDGSADGTRDLITSRYGGDARVRYRYQPNAGRGIGPECWA